MKKKIVFSAALFFSFVFLCLITFSFIINLLKAYRPQEEGGHFDMEKS